MYDFQNMAASTSTHANATNDMNWSLGPMHNTNEIFDQIGQLLNDEEDDNDHNFSDIDEESE